MAKQATKMLGAMFTAGLLSSCDPGVHLAWQDSFSGPIDRGCVQKAVKSVAGKISVSTYVSDGAPFPKGITVYQIWYEQPFNDKLVNASSGYRIEIAPMPDGSTGFYHGWGKLGTEIPSQERDYVVPVMAKVNTAIAKLCGVSVGNGNPVQGDG
jgi:hypothetical protein